MKIKKRKKTNQERKATYTVEVPIKFTFAGNNDLSGDDLFKVAIKECYKRLESGYFDVLENELHIRNKLTHYTREEIRERNRQWEEFIFGGVKQ